MNRSVFNQVCRLREEHPPSIAPTSCELCGGSWLVTISNRDRYGLPTRFEMCRQCGLVTQNPRWDHAPYLTFYTEFYRALISEWKGSENTPLSGDGALVFFRKMAASTGLEGLLPQSPRVLDIGGGIGTLAEHIRDEYGAEVTIVEPNAQEAEEAAKKGFDVVVDVFEDARFEPASFDLVVMLRTVDHLINASETFAKIRAALKPTGHFLVDGVDYFRRMAYSQDAVTPLKIDHCYYFSPESLTLLMSKNGLHSVVSDVTALPGSIVNLARVGEPQDVSVQGLQMLPGAEHRYFEWEQLADRPNFATKPGYMIRSIYSDMGWMGKKVASKFRKGDR